MTLSSYIDLMGSCGMCMSSSSGAVMLVVSINQLYQLKYNLIIAMSFVIGDSKRELDFFMNQQQTCGPLLGPGSYYTPQRYNSSEGKVPFGSGSRRKLQAPHIEMIHDMLQFRIIPDHRSIQNQTMPELHKQDIYDNK